MKRSFEPSHYSGAVSGGAGAAAGAASLGGGLKEITFSIIVGAITALTSEIVLDWYKEKKEEWRAEKEKH